MAQAIGNQTVPVSVNANPAATAAQPTVNSQPQTQPATAAASGTLPQGAASAITTSLLNSVQQQVSRALDVSVRVGQWLYVRIAMISIVLAVIGWFLAGESMAGLIRLVYFRLLEATLWMAMIGWTWTGPGGMPGWFPAIIGGIVSIGAEIANEVSGMRVAAFESSQFTFTILPGTILDLGAGIFGGISTLAWNTFAGGGGNGNPLVGAASGVVAVVGGALTGTLFINGVIYLLMMLSGIYAYCVCAYIAFRYLIVVFRVYTLACLSFLQGFAASRRLSGYAGGFLSIAIVIGSEFALITILVGVFYSVITALIQQTALWPFVLNIVAASGGATPIGEAAAITHTTFSIGYLLFLDVILSIWAYSVSRVPSMVSDFFAGRLSVSTSDVKQFLSSSPGVGAKLAGSAVGALQTAAQRGPLAAVGDGARRIAAIGLAGASTRKTGVAGIAEGAMRGGIVGGMPGAAVGAVAAAVAGRGNQRKNVPTMSENSPPKTEQQTTASSAHKEGNVDDVSPTQPSDRSVTRTVTIEDQYVSDGDTDAHDNEPAMSAASTQKRSSIFYSAAPTNNSQDASGDITSNWKRFQKGAAGTINSTLDDMDMQMNVASMVTQRVVRNAQYRSDHRRNTLGDDLSASPPTPRIHLGN